MILKKIIRLVFLLFVAILLIATFAFLTALYYKNDILASVKSEINQRVNGNIDLKEINVNFFQYFPNLSLSIIDIKVSDSLYHIHKKHLFSAENISFSVSLYALFFKELEVKEIKIKNGYINLFKDNNYFNGNIIRPDSSQGKTMTTDLPIDFTLKKIELQNIAFSYIDPSKKRKIAFIVQRNLIDVDIQPEGIILVSKGKYDVDQLTFKEQRGSFLQNKKLDLELRTHINVQNKLITFNDSEIKLEGEKYQLDGMLEMNAPAKLTLDIHSKDASLDKVKRLLTKRVAFNLSKIKLKKRAAGRAKIVAILVPNNQPMVDVNFEVKKSIVGFKDWEAFAEIIKGSYCNHDDSTKAIGDENSKITFSEFKGEYLTVPIKGAGYIKNIKEPLLYVAGSSAGSIDLLNSFLNPEKMEFNGGKFKLDFVMNGKLALLSNKKTFRSGKSSLLVKGMVTEANCSYFPRGLEFASINGNFNCDWNDLHISSLSLLLNKNKINLNGDVLNLTSFILSEQEKVKGDFHVSSPGIVFDHFSFTKEKSKRKRKERSTMTNVVAKMDKLIDIVEFDLNFKTPSFTYRQFKAQDIKGTVTVINSDFILNNFSFKSAQGLYKFSGAIKNIGSDNTRLSAKGNISEADVQEVFASFENFKQNTLSDKNLKGKINATIDFEAKIDHSGKILAESMRGDFSIQVKNGHLINFEPIQKLGGFIFKNRDFKDISFEDMQNRFVLKGKTLSVGKMEIISSVFTLYVDGVHNFDSFTDLNIQAPVSNLKKRSKVKKVKVENGVKNVGLSVFVKAYSDGEKMRFSYQPFKSINGNKVLLSQDSVNTY